jgi:hypothetical protein
MIQVDKNELNNLNKYSQILGSETVTTLKAVFDKFRDGSRGVPTRQLRLALQALGRHLSPKVLIYCCFLTKL